MPFRASKWAGPNRRLTMHRWPIRGSSARHGNWGGCRQTAKGLTRGQATLATKAAEAQQQQALVTLIPEVQVMSIILPGTIPPPHLLQSRTRSWPSPYQTYPYPATASSPTSMSPQSRHSYMPCLPESPLPSQELNGASTSGWYNPSISAPECPSETSYASYSHYMPPHTSSVNLSPPTPSFPYTAKSSVSAAQMDPSVTMSPGTVYSRESVLPDSSRPSEEPQSDIRNSLHQSSSRMKRQSHLLDRNHSNPGSLHSPALDVFSTMNPLGIHTNHDSYYPAFQTLTHSPRLSVSSVELPSHQMASPQPRRMYTPIAPQPHETPRSHGTKRYHEEDEETPDDSKRRKRSDSQTSTQFELSEEDRLLLRLKEQENMPWKDIAATFLSKLGKNYQIPALQMRLKRLRERMRVWTDLDLKALRMAHDYWAQNKFEIISQKMLEYGAQEKWTPRQCSRKWQEMDPPPMPYTHFEPHVQQGFAPYAISPIEPPSNSYLPFLNAQ
ncbi:ER lumen protein retaining receptor [Stemphylium lycopersici]|nr:ER lumen protein retaining receptor [Stemphylium lycopersici]